MYLWRISNYTSLDGRGGLFASARWHTSGRPIVYLAETAAGALIEVLVHLELDLNNLPQSYTLLKAEAPDNVSIRTLSDSDLPPNWRQNETAARSVGDEWLASGTHALLRVPSAILPETFNVLLNPGHPHAAQVKVLWCQEYPWDRRLFA